MNLTTATPLEIDTALAALDNAWHALDQREANTLGSLRASNGERAKGHGARRYFTNTPAETVEVLTARLAAGTIVAYDVVNVRKNLAKLDELAAAKAANRAEAAPLHAEYDRRPWARFFLVDGGHIHSGLWCAGGSIRPTTSRGWVPELSDKDEAAAVAKLGPLLCTKCFPSAPTEYTRGVEKPAACKGSGGREVPGTFRRSGMTGFGRCPECDENITVTSGGVLRKHKPAKVG